MTTLLLFTLIITVYAILCFINTIKLHNEISALENEIDALEYERNYLKARNNLNVPEIVEEALKVYEYNDIKIPTDIVDTVSNKGVWYNVIDVFDEIERQRSNWNHECKKKI